MFNVYYNPDKFGLTPVGEVEWSSGSYEFDMTVVWRKPDGSLVYGEDSGCSCPSPFEGHGVNDLTSCTPASLQAHLEERNRYRDASSAAIADLMVKVTN